VKTAVEIPNLIDIQKTSYDKFLQSDISSKERNESPKVSSSGLPEKTTCCS